MMKKQTKQQQQKRPRRYQGLRGNQKTHRGEKKHTQRRETASERSEQTHKKSIRDRKKNEKTARHPKYQESNLQREECSSPRSRMQKEKSSRLGKGLPMSLVNSTKNFSTTMNKKKLNKKSERTKMRAQQQHQCDDENPRDHDRRVANCNQQTQKSQIPRQQRNQSRRDINDDETREMVRQIFNEIMKQNEFTPEA